MEAAGVALSFAAVLYLSIKKVSMARVMFTATAILAVTSAQPLERTASLIWAGMTEKTTLELAAAVLAIGVFSTIMKEIGFLQTTVSGLSRLLGNVKAAIMAAPALIGSMPVLGGAALSAPLVDDLGKDLDMDPDLKAAANLVFRHGMFFIFPFSPGLILAAKLTGFTVTDLIARLWPMSLALWGMGYVVLLRKVGPSPALHPMAFGQDGASEETCIPVRTERGPEARIDGLRQFVKYGSPLLLALVCSLALKWPLWLSLAGGTALACALAALEKRPFPSLETVYRGANLSQVAAMFWIMAFKALVSESPVFPSLIQAAASRGASPVVMAALLPLAFGFISASQSATVAVLVPALVPASLPSAVRMYYTCTIYAASFTAYFVSPLHLCQVLTCQYFGVDISRIYRRNFLVLLTLAAMIAGYAAMTARLIR